MRICSVVRQLPIINHRNIFFPFFLDYVDILRLNLVERRLQLPSYPATTADGKATLGYQPPPLTSGYVAVNKQDLITTHRTRFARQL